MAERIGEFFLRISVMTSEQIKEVLRLQEAGDKRTFGDIALSMGYVDVHALKAYADFASGK
ncbi:MAG: hypothetical protein ABSG85_14250 [Spirochaetia bacterium]|jgi:hypothetical protein